MTTHNLGGKKICWARGVAEYFDCCSGRKLCGFQNLEKSLKTTRSIGVQSRILPIKNVSLFLPSPKYRRLSFTKKLGSGEREPGNEVGTSTVFLYYGKVPGFTYTSLCEYKLLLFSSHSNALFTV